jgi:hypothetical protein
MESVALQMIRRPVRSEGLELRTLKLGCLAVIEPGSGVTHILNRTASFIFSLCDGLHSVEEIARSLSTHFTASSGAYLLGDVRATIRHLSLRRLVAEASVKATAAG